MLRCNPEPLPKSQRYQKCLFRPTHTAVLDNSRAGTRGSTGRPGRARRPRRVEPERVATASPAGDGTSPPESAAPPSAAGRPARQGCRIKPSFRSENAARKLRRTREVQRRFSRLRESREATNAKPKAMALTTLRQTILRAGMRAFNRRAWMRATPLSLKGESFKSREP